MIEELKISHRMSKAVTKRLEQKRGFGSQRSAFLADPCYPIAYKEAERRDCLGLMTISTYLGGPSNDAFDASKPNASS